MTNLFQPTSDRVQEQVALYEGTDGGGTLEGRPIVVGRRLPDALKLWHHAITRRARG
jgi:hypothetical protein